MNSKESSDTERPIVDMLDVVLSTNGSDERCGSCAVKLSFALLHLKLLALADCAGRAPWVKNFPLLAILSDLERALYECVISG